MARKVGALIDDEFVDQQPLIPYDSVGVDDGKMPSGKTLESLAASRQVRDDILRAFHGDLPQSIMVAKKHGRDSDAARGTYGKGSAATPEQVALSKSFFVSGVGGHGDREFLSQFPQNIGRNVVLLYSEPGDTVVDPFAGHNSRMELVIKCGRNYKGKDLSHSFMEWNRKVAEQLRRKYPRYRIDLYEGDSRNMWEYADNAGDFTVTSPPYWCTEEYGDEPGQLGHLEGGYKGFLKGMAEVVKENYRILKPGAFCVYFVNDFRRDKKFYPYHRDTMDLLEGAGFILHDMIITDLGPTIRAAFATQVVQQKILPKRHEYGIVARKPERRKAKRHDKGQPTNAAPAQAVKTGRQQKRKA